MLSSQSILTGVTAAAITGIATYIYVQNSLPPSTSTTTLKKKRIAVLGGSFNPPTDGHLLMAANIIHTGSADEVWLVPCGPRPDKPSMTTSARDRLLLLHVAVETTFSPSFPIKVDAEEVERERALTTPHLLSIYDQKYPNYDFYFVVGTDLLDGLHTWDDNYPGWELQRNLIVMDRPGYVPDNKWKSAQNVHFLFATTTSNSNSNKLRQGSNLPPKQVHSRSFVASNESSSEVRHRIEHNQTTLQTALGASSYMTQGLVPFSVMTLTEKIGLYGVASQKKIENVTSSSEDNDSGDDPSTSSSNGAICNRCHSKSICKCSNTCRHNDNINAATNTSTSTSKSTSTSTSSTSPTSLGGRGRTASFRNEKTGVVTIHNKSYDVSMIRRQRSSKLRIAIFGGSFDPITSSHLKMAAEVIHTDAADEVWLVPCGRRLDKPDLLNAKDRYTMCQLAVTTTFSANFPGEYLSEGASIANGAL